MDIVCPFAICVGETQTVVQDVEIRNASPACITELRHEMTKANVQMKIRHAKIQMSIMTYRTDRVAALALCCTGEGWVAFEDPILES